jgi:4-amino-4-deoxy-L-arabinose transferase-like glycosyltransferase
VSPASSRGARIARAWLGWALGLLTVVIVMHDQRAVGIARDETVYMAYGPRYVDWWAGLVTFQHGVSEAGIKATFGGNGDTDNNREHPPLMKTLLGVSERVLHRRLGWLDEVSACRLPTAALAGVLIALVYAFTLAVWGWTEAVLAALLVMLLPRALFHAGLACFDAPITTLWFATIDAYRRGLTSRRWQLGAGVMFGLALATKHNALLLPVPLGLHYAWVAYRAQGAARAALAARPRGWRVATARLIARGMWVHRPRLVLALALVGPLTLFVLWPWLWFHPIRHVQQWLAFHLHHVHYNYEYLGSNWNAPPFPWHVAVVTTLFTVPVVTLVGAALGGALLVARALRRSAAQPEQAPALLLALSAAASIGPFFLGSTPIFGAEKH